MEYWGSDRILYQNHLKFLLKELQVLVDHQFPSSIDLKFVTLLVKFEWCNGNLPLLIYLEINKSNKFKLT